MLHTLVRALVISLIFVPDLALADAELVPLPLTSAGFGFPEGAYQSSYDKTALPLGRPVTAVTSLEACVVSTGGGIFHLPPAVICSPVGPLVTELDGGAIAIDTPQFQFHATLASVAAGNRWTVELQNPTLTFSNPALVGKVPDGSVISLQLYIDAFPSAVFTVADVTDGPTEAIAFRKIPTQPLSPGTLVLLEASSAKLAESAVPFAPGLLETFLDGDSISVLGRISFQVSFGAVYFPLSTTSVVLGTSFSLTDPCGTATGADGLPAHACKVGSELFEAHRATAVASLACRADLSQDGAVNFKDLALLKSVFFQSCQP